MKLTKITSGGKHTRIREGFHGFWRTIFSSEGIDSRAQDPLIDALDKNNTEELCQDMTREASPAEVHIILKTLPSLKAPGPDGLPYELYQVQRRAIGDASPKQAVVLGWRCERFFH